MGSVSIRRRLYSDRFGELVGDLPCEGTDVLRRDVWLMVPPTSDMLPPPSLPNALFLLRLMERGEALRGDPPRDELRGIPGTPCPRMWGLSGGIDASNKERTPEMYQSFKK